MRPLSSTPSCARRQAQSPAAATAAAARRQQRRQEEGVSEPNYADTDAARKVRQEVFAVLCCCSLRCAPPWLAVCRLLPQVRLPVSFLFVSRWRTWCCMIRMLFTHRCCCQYRACAAARKVSPVLCLWFLRTKGWLQRFLTNIERLSEIPARKRSRFGVLSLCLSRACLGKMMI